MRNAGSNTTDDMRAIMQNYLWPDENLTFATYGAPADSRQSKLAGCQNHSSKKYVICYNLIYHFYINKQVKSSNEVNA